MIDSNIVGRRLPVHGDLLTGYLRDADTRRRPREQTCLPPCRRSGCQVAFRPLLRCQIGSQRPHRVESTPIVVIEILLMASLNVWSSVSGASLKVQVSGAVSISLVLASTSPEAVRMDTPFTGGAAEPKSSNVPKDRRISRK